MGNSLPRASTSRRVSGRLARERRRPRPEYGTGGRRVKTPGAPANRACGLQQVNRQRPPPPRRAFCRLGGLDGRRAGLSARSVVGFLVAGGGLAYRRGGIRLAPSRLVSQ